MRYEKGELVYSPSDLMVFMESPFASWCERLIILDPEYKKFMVMITSRGCPQDAPSTSVGQAETRGFARLCTAAKVTQFVVTGRNK
mgnify:CR=1 FL=1